MLAFNCVLAAVTRSYHVLATPVHSFPPIGKDAPVTGSKRDEHWRELCRAIVQEPDAKRLMELVDELNQVLQEREEESKGTSTRK